MKLYGFPPSPNTWKVRAVAAHSEFRSSSNSSI